MAELSTASPQDSQPQTALRGLASRGAFGRPDGASRFSDALAGVLGVASPAASAMTAHLAKAAATVPPPVIVPGSGAAPVLAIPAPGAETPGSGSLTPRPIASAPQATGHPPVSTKADKPRPTPSPPLATTPDTVIPPQAPLPPTAPNPAAGPAAEAAAKGGDGKQRLANRSATGTPVAVEAGLPNVTPRQAAGAPSPVLTDHASVATDLPPSGQAAVTATPPSPVVQAARPEHPTSPPVPSPPQAPKDVAAPPRAEARAAPQTAEAPTRAKLPASVEPSVPSVLPDELQNGPPAAAPAPEATRAESAPAQTVSSPVIQVAPAVVHIVSADSGTQITLRLTPQDLGHLDIRIDRPAEGPAQISLTAQRPETLALLQRDQSQLHEALDRAGIPTDQRVISFHLAAADTTSASTSVAASHSTSPQDSFGSKPNQQDATLFQSATGGNAGTSQGGHSGTGGGSPHPKPSDPSHPDAGAEPIGRQRPALAAPLAARASGINITA